MIHIDKSIFSADELKQYEALIAKATVDPEAAQDEMDEEMPPEVAPKKKTTEKAEVEDMDDTKKTASPELTKALEELETLKKSIEMKDMLQVAKKYAPLGKKEDELAQTLYDMKKSNEANYTAYVSILDESLGLVEKSGVFAEIGKSGSSTPVGAVAKIEAAADDIQKSDATMTRVEAIAKAWENHPELVAEYDAEYKA